MQDLDFSDFVMPGDGVAEGPETAPALADPAAPVVVANTCPGSVVLVLLAPPLVDGKRLGRITIRAITQDDIDDLADGTLPNRRALLCRLVGRHPAVIKALTWADSRRLHEIFIDALPDFLKE